MKKYCLQSQINALVLVLIFTSSCNAQNNTKGQAFIPIKTINSNKLTKITKTQGTNEYQNVHCGLQDKAGNLWFGTTGEGVYRYDGKLFTQYTINNGLSSNKVWSILEDKEGNIWFGTDNGICKYDGKTISQIPISNLSVSFINASTKQYLSKQNSVWSMLQDKNGTIWFGTDEGLFCYSGKSFSRFLDNPNIIHTSNFSMENLQCMLQDKKGNIWFGSGFPAFEGIFRFDGKTVENFKPKDEGWIRAISEDKNGNILFATRHYGVCSYDGNSFTYISKSSQGMVNGLMMATLEDSAGNMWFASDYGSELNDTVGGVWRFDGKTYTKYSIKEGLTNNAVFFMMQDRNENIWVGTRNIGLYRFNGKTFTNYAE